MEKESKVDYQEKLLAHRKMKMNGDKDVIKFSTCKMKNFRLQKGSEESNFPDGGLNEAGANDVKNIFSLL